MTTRRLVVVHNNIDQRSAIGTLAMWAVRTGLDAGYSVVTVAKDLDLSLQEDVQHLPLHVPKSVFAYQWARARATVKNALGSTSYDLLHTYQPQLTGMADTWHAQFLTRSAQEAGSFPQGRDARARSQRAQLRIVTAMEDRYLRRLSGGLHVLFPSQYMEDEFAKLYGPPIHSQLLPNPAPPVTPVGAEQRRRSREALIGSFDGVVVGYLGGLDDRKGWRELVDAAAAAPEAFLLFGGTGSEGFSDGRLKGRCHAVGYVSDLSGFLAACDVLAVPSSFDPFAMVVTEAAARGVPSITTPNVGAQAEALRFRAGLSWDGRAESFASVVHSVGRDLAELGAGALRMANALSEKQLSGQLRDVWAEALEGKLERQRASS